MATLLDRVTIPVPCSASWERMIGDEPTRFCRSCRKYVYNLAAMSEAEAEAALQIEACIRIYRRPDGTVVTGDCRDIGRSRFAWTATVCLAFFGSFVCALVAYLGVASNAQRLAVAERIPFPELRRLLVPEAFVMGEPPRKELPDVPNP